MLTRGKVDIVKPSHIFDLLPFAQSVLHKSLFEETNPKGIKTALKHQHWKDVINDEFMALHQNHRWTLVPHPKSSNVVGSK